MKTIQEKVWRRTEMEKKERKRRRATSKNAMFKTTTIQIINRWVIHQPTIPSGLRSRRTSNSMKRADPKVWLST